MRILKYLLLATILYVALNYFQVKLDNTQIIGIVGILIVGLWIFEKMIIEKEGMRGNNKCGYHIPNTYNMNSENEDHLQSGIKYDHRIPIQRPMGDFSSETIPFSDVRREIELQRYNEPGYYLANDGKYSDLGIPYDQVAEIITKSKLHDLYHQHNHNITWSPHTHIGKARGRMNLEQTQ